LAIDNAQEVAKLILLDLTENSPIRKGLELYLRSNLKLPEDTSIDVLLAHPASKDIFNKAVDHLKEDGTIGGFLSFCAKGSHTIMYDLPDALNNIQDIIGFGKDGFFTKLTGNDTVDFVGDMLGNAVGGVIKSVGMYSAGEFISNHFQEEFFELYKGPERLVQELLAGEKVPKEEEERYRRKLEQIEDSFLTDDEWEAKYATQKYTIIEEKAGKLWGTNKVEKEYDYKKEHRGKVRREAINKAKDVIKEGSDIFEGLKDHQVYGNMVNQLKEGNLEILSRVNESQLKKIVKTLKDKKIDTNTIKEFETLHEKALNADREGHGIYDQNYSREKAMEDMIELYKSYETYAKGAFFRSLYLEGKRDEEGNKVESIFSQQTRKLLLASEEKKEDIPLLIKLKNAVLTLKMKQGIDKNKLKKIENNELNDTLYGEKPIDKVSFEISKGISKNMIKLKYS